MNLHKQYRMERDNVTSQWVPSGSHDLPANLLSGYKLQWALTSPLGLLSGKQITLVSAYKLATQSQTFCQLIKEIGEQKKRHHNQQIPLNHLEDQPKEPPLIVDCHRSVDINDLAFAIHFCHLGRCQISATNVIERSDSPPIKRRDETFPEKETVSTRNTVLLSTGQLHLTTTMAECSLACGLRVANTYGIESLHKYCISYIKKNLNVENCWALWRTIFTSSRIPTNNSIFQVDEKAGQVLLNFMLENFHRFTPISLIKGIGHFSASELELILASDRLNVHSESEVVSAIEIWVNNQSKSSDVANVMDKITLRLIKRCVRFDHLEVADIDRLLQLPGMQMKKVPCISRIGDGAIGESLRLPNFPPSRRYDSRKRCVWLLQRLRRRLVRATRNLRSLSPRRMGPSERTENWTKLGARIPHEIIIVFGGWENGQPCQNVRVLDSRRGVWNTYNAESGSSLVLPHPLMSFGIACVENEIIYIAGGEIKSGHATQEVLRYDFRCSITNRAWKGCAPMHDVRRDFILVNFQNKMLYAIGGDNNRNVLDSVEALLLDKNKSSGWIEVASMIIPRGAPAGDTVGSQIYICGGYTESRMEALTSSCETYNPRANQWTLIQPMAQPRYYASAVSYHDHLYILGGGGDNTARMETSVMALGYSSTVERYTPEEGVWELMPGIAERADFAACVHEDEIFCIGGGGEAFCTGDVESWRPWVGRIRRSEDQLSSRNEDGDNTDYHLSNNNVPGPSSSNAPIWMPYNENEGSRSTVEAFSGWHKDVQLPLPIWGHRCVSIKGVDKVIEILPRESQRNKDDRQKIKALRRWKIKRSGSSTVICIVDAQNDRPESRKGEKETDTDENGEDNNGKVQV